MDKNFAATGKIFWRRKLLLTIKVQSDELKK